LVESYDGSPSSFKLIYKSADALRLHHVREGAPGLFKGVGEAKRPEGEVLAGQLVEDVYGSLGLALHDFHLELIKEKLLLSFHGRRLLLILFDFA